MTFGGTFGLQTSQARQDFIFTKHTKLSFFLELCGMVWVQLVKTRGVATVKLG